MDGFNEKKWFVYLVDHHEGPLSLAEIQVKMAGGQVTRSTYVWTEGMPDWKPMNEVPSFESIGNTTIASDGPTALNLVSPSSETHAAQEPSLAAIAMPTLAIATPEESNPIPEMALAIAEPEPSSAPAMAVAVAEPAAEEPGVGVATTAAEAIPAPLEAIPSEGSGEQAQEGEHVLPSKKKRVGMRIIRIAFFLGVPSALVVAGMQGHLDPVLKAPAVKAGLQAAQDFAQPHLLSLAEKFPALGKWVSPIPALEDVTPEEYEDLKTAAMGKVEKVGPKVSFALSRGDLTAPQFYVASNLTDGASFEVYVEGVSDTLLNHLSFSSKGSATVTQKLGKTQTIRFPDGKPLPKGEYVIYLMESDQQPPVVTESVGTLSSSQVKIPPHLPKGRKMITKKVYFLGGAKDATYSARLKEFHDKLKARAMAEMNEVKQFAGLLEGQLSLTQADFTRLRKGPRPSKAQVKSWTDAHGKWTQLDAQFAESAKKWQPETLDQEYFYGVLYRHTQQAGEAITRLHGVHHAYFTGKVDPKSFEIQLGEATSQAQTALSALKAKIEQAEKMPPAPSGVPRREGL